MKYCILGVCGTFMANLAILIQADKKSKNTDKVVGMDSNFYMPVSGLLQQAKIKCISNYQPKNLPKADLYIIGNALTRGMPVVEHILNNKLPYVSGPQWLAENVLRGRKVVAVAGTHGKTTTTALLSKLLTANGRDSGYLIAGASKDFAMPVHRGKAEEFVIEADEYDCAFFDKRSKFIHYKPDLLLINNLEYDHADIFPDLTAIENQFCQLLRSMPSSANIVYPLGNKAIARCLAKEPHSRRIPILGVFSDPAKLAQAAAQHKPDKSLENGLELWGGIVTADGLQIKCFKHKSRAKSRKAAEKLSFSIDWRLPGRHNALNLLFASVAALTLRPAWQKNPAKYLAAAQDFQGVSRRLERLGTLNKAEVISDFAHHPTAIKLSLQALKQQHRGRKIIAVVDLASNSIRLGTHGAKLRQATAAADEVLWYAAKELNWSRDLRKSYGKIHKKPQDIFKVMRQRAKQDVLLVIFSNSALGGLAKGLVKGN